VVESSTKEEEEEGTEERKCSTGGYSGAGGSRESRPGWKEGQVQSKGRIRILPGLIGTNEEEEEDEGEEEE
jgi:hypothetical protein